MRDEQKYANVVDMARDYNMAKKLQRSMWKMYEKEVMDGFERIFTSGKVMDDMNEDELKNARRTIKDIRASKDTFLNGWVDTELKRYGRLTKHDLLRILISMRLKDLADALKDLEKEGELWEVRQLDWQNLKVE